MVTDPSRCDRAACVGSQAPPRRRRPAAVRQIRVDFPHLWPEKGAEEPQQQAACHVRQPSRALWPPVLRRGACLALDGDDACASWLSAINASTSLPRAHVLPSLTYRCGVSWCARQSLATPAVQRRRWRRVLLVCQGSSHAARCCGHPRLHHHTPPRCCSRMRCVGNDARVTGRCAGTPPPL